MADSVSVSLPIYEKIRRKNPIQRTIDVTILVLLLSLVSYRLLHLSSHGFSWIVAIFCESCFAFVWFLTANIKWDPMEDKPYLDRLDMRTYELPAVDMFVTTADPVLEPPIITVNTVLSLLAVNYPANKLACYVSDDGCSPLIYFSLVETAKFAKIWVPFCKKYNLQIRAPFRYFLDSPKSSHGAASAKFLQEYKNTKAQYEQLISKLENATKESFPLDDFPEFLNVERRNHSSIIKVILENMETREDDESIPHLIYISREKRPNCPHHYKAGAMNVLARVSGIMTNAPVMLNVDCDMYAHNPEIVRLAMCLFLGSDKDCAFVQSPQMFYDCPGNEMIVLHEFMGRGLVGLRGPFYAGTGCFHKRMVIYGLSVDDLERDGSLSLEAKGKLSVGKLNEEFGSSKELIKSASEAFEGNSLNQNAISNSLEAAHHVASSSYEDGTAWGKTIGWSYGSTTEDINTGTRIHSMGWKSLYSSPDPPAFLGCAPPGGPAAMRQQKRWAAGMIEVLFGPNCPIIGVLFGKLPVRQALAYMYIDTWGFRSVPELLYSLLPAYCIINDSSFLPQGPVIFIPLALFVIYNLYTLSEYLRMNLSVQTWWNAQQFARIKITGPWLFSISEIALKLLGLSEMSFEITKKTVAPDNGEDQNQDAGRFVFDDSPYFIPGTAILMANLVALAGLLVCGGCSGTGLGDILCSVWVVLSFWSFLRGLFEEGKYGIPFSTVCKSAALAFLFVQLSRRGRNEIFA